MPSFPSGTVTFLFTDIEGSTALWERWPDGMREALETHDTILRDSIESQGGQVFKTIGDAFCAAFGTASEALAAAAAAQSALAAQPWGEIGDLRVRMALNTGEASERDGDYFGPALNRVARLLAVAYGGQTLLSAVSEALVRDALPDGARLEDLGEHRLRDLGQAQRIFSLQQEGLPGEFPPLLTVDALPNNLPGALSSFVGRERELAEIASLLPEVRLLTLTGVGGTGKTRLALQTGADLLDRYPDGVWFVPLAEYRDEERVARAVAAVFGIREQAGRSLEELLQETLKEKQRPLMLILDNCEHLIGACARLCDLLLRSAPKLTVLATSREGLAIPGERIMAVASLSLPEDQAPGETFEHWIAGLNESASIRLCVERASAASPSFALSEDNAEAVVEICRRLDGIPLAIELAAARTRALSPTKLAARLDQRFRILTGGSRTALPRQQTLAATIDWSYDLLDENERLVLQRLSVFVGGCTLESAEQVCAGDSVEDWEVLDLLTSLVEKSLLMLSGEGEWPRYRLLETVRQYARDQLVHGGMSETYRRRHLDHFVERATEELAVSTGGSNHQWYERSIPEHGNVTAAIEWAYETDDIELAARLLVATVTVFGSLGEWTQSLAWAEKLLSRGEAIPPRLRTNVLLFAAADAGMLGRHDAALDLALRARELATRHGLSLLQAHAQVNLGTGYHALGKMDQADACLSEAIEQLRALGDRIDDLSAVTTLRGLRRALAYQGFIAIDRRDWPLAEQLQQEVLDLTRESESSQDVAGSLSNLASVYLMQEEIAQAEPLFAEALSLAEASEATYYTANIRQNFGACLYRSGDVEAARDLCGAARRYYRENGPPEYEANAIDSLGAAALMEGDLTLARRELGLALDIRQSLQSQQTGTSLQMLGMLALAEDSWARGLRLLSASDAPILKRDPQDLPEGNLWIAQRLDDLQAARASLGDAATEAALAAGKAMTLEEAVQEAVGDEGQS